jgi:uncharacterized Zn finger protein
VQGSREEPYAVEVLIDELTDAEWARFLDTVAAQAGHVAALLEREMPHELVSDALSAGVRLLPGLGDLEPFCTCPDDGHPCKHAAALCYQAARLLDADPFVLLLLRGRGERELVAELQRRTVVTEVVVDDDGDPVGPREAEPVDAAAAYAGYSPAALPEVPAPAGAAALLDVPAAHGVDPAALRLLAVDAAARARQALTADDALVLDEWTDRVRMAATHRDAVLWARLGDGAGERFDRAVWAWTFAGAAGVDALQEVWSPPAADAARARAAIAAVFADDAQVPGIAVWRNRFTIDERDVQVRLGRDGLWYPYRRRAGEWWPGGPPGRDAGAVVSDLLAPA